MFIDEKYSFKPSRRDLLISKFLSPQATQFYADILMLIIGYILYYYIKFETGWFYNVVSPDLFIPMIILLLYWMILFWLSGLYKNWYVRSPFDEFFLILRVTFFGSFIVFFLVLLDSNRYPRMVFLVYFAIITLSIAIGRLTSRKVQKRIRRKQIFAIPSVIVGTLEKANDFIEKVRISKSWGYNAIGIILTDSLDENNSIKPLEPILGYIDNLPNILNRVSPAELLITVDSPKRSTLVSIANECAERNIIVKIVPDLYDIFTGLVRTLPIYGIPLIEINTQLLKPWEKIIKRFIDIIMSLIILLVGLPLWIIIAILIKIESRGPVFYKQERVGKDGKPFVIYKFRSMVQDAQKQGSIWTTVNDPRVTKIGYFIRKTHIDEFPQFLNVLKSEMSLVGPRPEQTVIVNKYSSIVPYYKRRHVVKPGITGWWQVNYVVYEESVEEIESRLKDDFYYIENMSLKLDLEIIVRTVILMFRMHGQS